MSNRENTDRWIRVISTRLVGAEGASLDRIIETLQLERLLIEHAIAQAAFRFDMAAVGAGAT